MGLFPGFSREWLFFPASVGMVSVFPVSHQGPPFSSMSRTGTFSTPADYLSGQSHMEQLFKTAEQYAAIKEDCRKLMPMWFGRCRILRLENGVLSIGAPNQALAARVRQGSSLLLHGLKSRGWEINQIRLKVSFDQTLVERKPPVHAKRLSEKARASFEALYQKLEGEGGQPDLRDSLKRLLNRR